MKFSKCMSSIAAGLLLAAASRSYGAEATPTPTATPEPTIIPLPVIKTAQAPMRGVDELPERKAMPNPLETDDGKIITNTKDWEAHRAELREKLEYYATGLMPPPPGNVKGKDLQTELLMDGTVEYRLVHLSFGPEEKLGFDIAIFTPADQKGPFPTFINPSFFGTPGATPLPAGPPFTTGGRGMELLAKPLGIAPTTNTQRRAGGMFPPMDPETAAERQADLFKRGYALVTYKYTDCGEDTTVRELDGSWAYRKTRFFPAYPDYDWGLLAAWAWGMSRVIDYLETQKFVDKKKMIATGHSRIGKEVVVEGAFEDRLAMVAPAGSAGGGDGAYRFTGEKRGGGEGLIDMMHKYPNWFSPHLYQFRHDPEKLPFDEHWFIALAAPRPYISLQGTGDHINSPIGIKASEDAARPVYELYGEPDEVGVNYADHPHAFTADDWNAAMDFADKYLRGMKVDRKFDQFPTPEESAAAQAQMR